MIGEIENSKKKFQHQSKSIRGACLSISSKTKSRKILESNSVRRVCKEIPENFEMSLRTALYDL